MDSCTLHFYWLGKWFSSFSSMFLCQMLLEQTKHWGRQSAAQKVPWISAHWTNLRWLVNFPELYFVANFHLCNKLVKSLPFCFMASLDTWKMTLRAKKINILSFTAGHESEHRCRRSFGPPRRNINFLPSTVIQHNKVNSAHFTQMFFWHFSDHNFSFFGLDSRLFPVFCFVSMSRVGLTLWTNASRCVARTRRADPFWLFAWVFNGGMYVSTGSMLGFHLKKSVFVKMVFLFFCRCFLNNLSVRNNWSKVETIEANFEIYDRMTFRAFVASNK